MGNTISDSSVKARGVGAAALTSKGFKVTLAIDETAGGKIHEKPAFRIFYGRGNRPDRGRAAGGARRGPGPGRCGQSEDGGLGEGLDSAAHARRPAGLAGDLVVRDDHAPGAS